MNSDRPEGKGGVPYHPSARRSIHSNKAESSLTKERMARYGLNKPKNRAEQDADDQSQQKEIDEVDNVMSKMSRQTSPLSIRKKRLQRTNSYSQDEDNTDESDCSEFDENNSLTKSRIGEESYYDLMNRSNTSNRSNRSTEHIQPSPFQRKLSISSRENSHPQSSNTIRKNFLPLLLVIVGVMLIWKFPDMITNNSQDKSTQTENLDRINFENNMNILQERYNIDDNSILKLKTGISTIFSRMDTGSFIFVYNSKTNNFNPVRFEKFADEVAFTAARFLRNDITSIKHTVVESSDLDMQEHGELITRYREDVDKSGVMLVKEIDAVPSDLAMAFHYYCDEYDPLVKRSAIFFTLNMANCSNTSVPKSIHDFIEKCLEKKWKTVPLENMRPLLTRVVDVIIDVTSVF